jgi:hypothetical protein
MKFVEALAQNLRERALQQHVLMSSALPFLFLPSPDLNYTAFTCLFAYQNLTA